MIKASNNFTQAIDDGNVAYLIDLGITFTDGTHIDLDASDVWSNGIKLEDATSSDSGLTIGAFVSTKLTLILNNITDKFTYYNFDNAHIDKLEIGLTYEDGTTEMISLGEYWVDNTAYNTSLITLTCTDKAREFNKDADFSGLSFPATLGEILAFVVKEACGSADYLATTEFANYSYMVSSKPTGDKHTWADYVACVSQIAGCFAKFHTDGKLYLEWYGGEVYSTDIDGGEFDHPTEESTPYETGDDVDGGDFSYNDTGKNYDGGFFTDMGTYHLIRHVKNITVNTDAFTITKITVKECFSETESLKMDIQSFSKYSGTSANAYDVQVQNNPLIQAGQAAAVARLIGDRVIGLTFRPLSVSAIANPLIEAGDIAYVIDRKGVTYHTFISHRTYTIGNGVTLVCAGKSAAEQMQKSYSETEKQIATVDEKLDDTQKEVEENKQETTVRLEKLDSSIEAEVTRASEVEGTLSSKITMTAEQIESEVSRANKAEGELSSRITQTSDSISSEVRRAKEAEGELSSKITQTANEISSEVSSNYQTKSEANSDYSYLSSRITQNAGQISLKVSADDVINAINLDSSGVKIQADKVQVSGDFSAKSLNTGNMKIEGASIYNQNIVTVSGSAWEFANNIYDYSSGSSMPIGSQLYWLAQRVSALEAKSK